MDNVMQAYLDRLEEIRLQHVTHLINGSVEKHEEYRHICGIIKGLAVADRELRDLVSQLEEGS